MPSKSVEQAKTMSAIAHGWKPKGSAAGIPVSVAKEFHEADSGHKYGARAFGGVAPMMAQAMNPVMNGVAPGMGPPPISPLGGTQNQSPTVSRPLKAGGVAGPGSSKPVKMTTGPLVSTVPGRTDLHFTHVPSGSYVIPADVVSGHGQGNTLAGMKHLHSFFRMGDVGTGSSPVAAQKHFAKGGTTDKHVGKPVPVKLAGGEIVVPPHNLHETMQRVAGKKLTLEEAHKTMDAWVVRKRKKLRRTLAKLPGPVTG